MDNVDKNAKIIGFLNEALKNEFSAIQQYWLHGLTLKHWGFNKIGNLFIKEAIEEREHVNLFTRRILQLNGYPIFDAINKVSMGDNIVEMLNLNLAFEQDTIIKYRHFITEITKHDDYTTVDVLTDVLREEEGHREWLQSQLRIIAEIGVAQYLAENLNSDDDDEDDD